MKTAVPLTRPGALRRSVSVTAPVPGSLPNSSSAECVTRSSSKQPLQKGEETLPWLAKDLPCHRASQQHKQSSSCCLLNEEDHMTTKHVGEFSEPLCRSNGRLHHTSSLSCPAGRRIMCRQWRMLPPSTCAFAACLSLVKNRYLNRPQNPTAGNTIDGYLAGGS